MFVEFKNLSDNSRILIYASETIISEDIQNIIGNKLKVFFKEWYHHGKPLTSSFNFLYNRFLVLGLDESKNPTGGCSMDKLQNLILGIDNFYKFNFFERMNVFVKIDNKTRCIHFSNLSNYNGISKETLFFNLNISNKKDLDNWLIPIKDGWCSRFLN
tara:strand:- start:418 stop:891 length:474 start_codon:yes stop_codon:yes gene_type:complete